MKPGWLFTFAVTAALIGLLGLRINSQKAIAMRNQIIAQDSAGLKVDEDLKNLQDFVFSHMNTSTSLELTGSYNRAVAAAKAAAETSESGELYTQAQTYCDRPGDSSIVQAQCVQAFLEDRLRPSSNPQPPKLPERSQYQYAFAAPNWTPDVPGIALLAGIILSITSVVIYWTQLLRRSF